MRLPSSAAWLVRHLGKGVPYAEGMRVMRQAIADVDDVGPQLLLLEHAPTITITRTGGTTFVRSGAEALAVDGIELVETDRGGDVTFHGPGQIVGYPIMRLGLVTSSVDLVTYLRVLEASLIDAMHRLGVTRAHRIDGATGVWVESGGSLLKLIAIGVGVRQGVTRHGFALNVTTELERYTRHIVPCGLVDKGVTSLARLLSSLPPEVDILHALQEELARALSRLASLPLSRAAAHDGAPHGG